jgi:hypothetical protein
MGWDDPSFVLFILELERDGMIPQGNILARFGMTLPLKIEEMESREVGRRGGAHGRKKSRRAPAARGRAPGMPARG